jgi:hypothetical protein
MESHETLEEDIEGLSLDHIKKISIKKGCNHLHPFLNLASSLF